MVRTSFTVIGIKAARKARSFHKTHIAFAMFLTVLAEKGIKARVSTSGEIWHTPEDGDAEGSEHQRKRRR